MSLGGGVYTSGASIAIESSRLSSNYADALGGGLYADLPDEGTLPRTSSVPSTRTPR